MLVSGNEDALDPIVETIHELGDALMGRQLAGSLGLKRGTARDLAERRLAQSLEVRNGG